MSRCLNRFSFAVFCSDMSQRGADITDIGGRDPGGGTGTTEVYQEGVRFGPVKIATRKGPVEDIIEIIRINSRSKDLIVGDINAMIASCRTGHKRLIEIVERFGLEKVEACRDEIFRQSERADRAGPQFRTVSTKALAVWTMTGSTSARRSTSRSPSVLKATG